MAGPQVGSPWNLPSKAVQAEVRGARQASAEAGWPEVSSTSVADFFVGRGVLRTGATGFLGRLTMELLLRSSPDVGKVYVLMRPKRGSTVAERLRAAVADPLFDRLRAERPGILEAKVHAVAGDISRPRLGLSDEDAALVCAEVSVFLNVAASVRFVEAIKNATLTNVCSVHEAVKLAKAMPRLKVMIHVSTAYANTHQPVLEERVYPAGQDWKTIVKAVEQLSDPDSLTILGPKLLGSQPNSYTFTKALAEQVIDEASSEIPVVIVRPSIVMGTDRDPVPGWVDNLYGFYAFWVLNSKGVARVVHAVDPTAPHNLIPGDLVAKTIVLAAWAKGVGYQHRVAEGYSGVEVVNSVAMENMGVSYEDMAYFANSILHKETPLPNAIRYPAITTVSSKMAYRLIHSVQHVGFGALVDAVLLMTGQKPRMLDVYRKYVVGLSVVDFFQRQRFPFIGKKQWRLQSLLLPSDTTNFCYLDFLDRKDSLESYTDYMCNLVIGIIKYCLREEFNPKESRAHLKKLWWLETVMNVIFSSILMWILWRSLT